MGYHPGIEDDGVYLTAIKSDLNPVLYPHDSAFFRVQLQATMFDKWVAAFIRSTHIPVSVTELLFQFISILLIIAGSWSIARVLFEEERFFEDDFFEDDFFFDEDFLEDDFLRDGTLPPSRRASERPIAIACLRLVTFFPEPPLFSVPCLRSCIAFSTLSDAFLPYFAMRFVSFAQRKMCKRSSWIICR